MWWTKSTFSPSDGLQGLQGRKHAHKGRKRGAIRFVHLAQGKLDVMRIQHAQPADLVFQRKHLRLELDAVVADQLWPHVQVRGLLHVRVAKLENNLRVAREKAVFVGDAPAAG